MPAYHYTREAGESGEVLAAEGAPPGRSLAVLLESNRPPLRAAFEIAAALADLLCIADEDQAVHGDLDPRTVFIAENGSVSIEGYGVQRVASRAPEGRGDVATADIYGLGVVLHSMLSDEPFGDMPADFDEHDDLVISRVLAMDFRAVQGRRWVDDVRKFLCNILASHAADRPLALDAANVLAGVADQVPGDGLIAWATGTNTAARPIKPMPAAQEILGGPTSLSAPLARGGVRQAPAAKGESTSFWSREKIAQMLADEDDEPMPAPSNVIPMRTESPRPLEEVSRSRGEDLSAPRRVGGGQSAPFTPAARDNSAGYAPARDASAAYAREPAFEAAPQREQNTPPPPVIPRPIAAPPVESDSVARPIPEPRRVETNHAPQSPASPPKQSVYAPPQPERAVYAPEAAEPAESSGGKGMMIGIGVVVLLGLACAGVAALGGGAWFFTSTPSISTTDVNVPATDDTVPAAEPPKTTEASPEPATATSASGATPATSPTPVSATAAPVSATAAPTPTPSSPPKTTATTPKTTSSAAPKTTAATTATTTTPKTTTTTTTPKTTTPATTTTPKTTATTSKTPVTTAAATTTPATGPYTVRFSVPGKEGRIQCGDGQDADFVGSTSLSFEGSVTCRIMADKKRGAVQLDHATSVSCSDVGTVLSCGGG